MGEGYDLRSLAYELSTKIANGFPFNMSTNPYTTNTTSYTRVGGGIMNLGILRYSKVETISFMAASGVLGGDGLDVQLYDVTNAAEVGVINFLGTEDNSVKFIDVCSYLLAVNGKIELEVNVRKAGPIGPSTFNTASISFEGLMKK